jgi:hypothetical protein
MDKEEYIRKTARKLAKEDMTKLFNVMSDADVRLSDARKTYGYKETKNQLRDLYICICAVHENAMAEAKDAPHWEHSISDAMAMLYYNVEGLNDPEFLYLAQRNLPPEFYKTILDLMSSGGDAAELYRAIVVQICYRLKLGAVEMLFKYGKHRALNKICRDEPGIA